MFVYLTAGEDDPMQHLLSPCHNAIKSAQLKQNVKIQYRKF
jgi:hypothetical protein